MRELAELGWILENREAYQLTAEGKRIREQAEALTNQYVLAPWLCLNEAEFEELSDLATPLRDRLKKVEGRKEVL